MIEPTADDPYPGLIGPERTLAHLWDLSIGPEIAKRQAAGILPPDYVPFIAQVLYPVEGPNRVLLDDEVKGVGLMRAQRAVKAGEAMTFNDLAHLEAFELPNDLIDHGHFTIIRRPDGWGMHFNFKSGRGKAQDMLRLAQQFLDASRHSAANGHAGPAVDTLFSAAELISKAELILHRNPAVQTKKHDPIKSAINAWSKLGNIDAAFVALYNRLHRDRPNARYGDEANRPPAPSFEDFELVAAVIEQTLNKTSSALDSYTRKAPEHKLPGTPS